MPSSGTMSGGGPAGGGGSTQHQRLYRTAKHHREQPLVHIGAWYKPKDAASKVGKRLRKATKSFGSRFVQHARTGFGLKYLWRYTGAPMWKKVYGYHKDILPHRFWRKSAYVGGGAVALTAGVVTAPYLIAAAPAAYQVTKGTLQTGSAVLGLVGQYRGLRSLGQGNAQYLGHQADGLPLSGDQWDELREDPPPAGIPMPVLLGGGLIALALIARKRK